MGGELQRYVPAYDPDEEVTAAGIAVSYWASLPYLGLYARTDDGQGEIGLRADLADLARVPVEFAAWWVADLAGRGLFLPPSAR